MRIRKDMTFAVLTTLCLSALMFAVISVRSGFHYEPWANHDDGTVKIKDLSDTAKECASVIENRT